MKEFVVSLSLGLLLTACSSPDSAEPARRTLLFNESFCGGRIDYVSSTGQRKEPAEAAAEMEQLFSDELISPEPQGTVEGELVSSQGAPHKLHPIVYHEASRSFTYTYECPEMAGETMYLNSPERMSLRDLISMRNDAALKLVGLSIRARGGEWANFQDRFRLICLGYPLPPSFGFAFEHKKKPTLYFVELCPSTEEAIKKTKARMRERASFCARYLSKHGMESVGIYAKLYTFPESRDIEIHASAIRAAYGKTGKTE